MLGCRHIDLGCWDLHTSIRIDLRSSIPEAQAAVEAPVDLPPSNRPKPKRKRMDVSENRGDFPPKWMVKIKENPIKHGMIWGYHYFWKHPNLPTIIFQGRSHVSFREGISGIELYDPFFGRDSEIDPFFQRRAVKLQGCNLQAGFP